MTRKPVSARSIATGPRSWVLLLLALLAACMPSGGGPAAEHSSSGAGAPLVPAVKFAYDVTCPTDPSKSPLPAELPPGETAAAGTVAGSFAVSQGGEATYTLPLVVPPGRAGMEPRLAVTYSSGSGHGTLGMGFSVQGLSVIARCPSNIAQDGMIRAVRNDKADHLCLDGARLVAVGAKTGVVPQFGPATLEYRTFPDSFAKIVAHFPAGWDRDRGPQSFEVFTRAGRILEYGTTASGQVLATNQIIAAWWITRERDRRGNTIAYTYQNDPDADGHTIEHNPQRIDYTGHPLAPASRAVVFDYQDLPSPSFFFSAGMRMRSSRLLHQIRALGPGDSLVQSTLLAYKIGEGTGHHLLETVKECAAGVCKPPTRFAWNSHPEPGLVKQDLAHRLLDADEDTESHGWRREWLMADVNGDGLDDIVISKPNPSKPSENQWVVALNQGGNFGAPEVWKSFDYPDPDFNWKWTPTPLDVDHDGLTDIILDAPNLSWPTYRWLHARPDHTFELLDTGIAHPPQVEVGSGEPLPLKPEHHRFMRLGDVNGDGVADLIQCWDKEFEVPGGEAPDLSKGWPEWTVHLWSPTGAGSGPGFDPTAVPIPHFQGFDCLLGAKDLYIIDMDGDGVAEVVTAESPPQPCPPGKFCGQTYVAVQYNGATWETRPTGLAQQLSWRKLHFFDWNGDGLPDALYTGFGCPSLEFDPFPSCYQNSPYPYGVDWNNDGKIKGDSTAWGEGEEQWSSDVPLLAVNHGNGFGQPAPTFPGPQVPDPFWTDLLGEHATPIDYNGDGRMDLLIPMKGHCAGGNAHDACWVVMQAPSSGADFFSVVDTNIPWSPPDVKSYDWWALQVTDVDGDGRHDIIVPDQDHVGRFYIHKSGGPQDLLIAVTDGMNALDPGDPGFLPSVGIEYGSLVDLATTQGLPAGSPKREDMTYLPRSSGGSDCDYPRACVVGPRRVVSRYTMNDGANEPRAFEVKYRDGRYHHLGRGSLGFGARIVIDQDTRAGTAEFFDNVTHDPVFDTYPFAGQVVRSWAWAPGLSGQPDPSQIELKYGAATLQVVPTNQGITYFTLPVVTRVQHEEGHFLPKPKETVFDYVAATEGSPATVLRESWRIVSDYDDYGDVLAESEQTAGVNVVTQVKRAYESNSGTWLVGLPSSEKVCSTALGMTQCRSTTLEHNPFGEVWSATAGDPADPETKLSLHYAHDAYGHVIFAAADDAFGRHRSACVSYDAAGMFPYAMGNGVGHISYAKFDAGLGVRTAFVDPNGLATQWQHDGFGRVTEEVHADGTSTTVWLARVKDGGPQGTWWNVKADAWCDGFGEQIVEYDSLGRSVGSWTRGPDVTACGTSGCTAAPWFQQNVRFDHLGQIAWTSLPWLASDTAATPLYHTFDHDAAGRVTKHTTPWGSNTTYSYDGNFASVTDSAGTAHATVDALGRPASVTDKAGHLTTYTYGPFGGVTQVDRPNGDVTTMTRDAYGRVRKHVDPDRGESNTDYDGFGEATFTVDALGRAYAFTYDALGRMIRRDDADGTTTWEHDTVPHGKGLLASVTSPAGHVRSFTYDDLSRPSTLALSLHESGATFQSAFTYDTHGRLDTIAYPQGDGVAPLVVKRDYDTAGNVVAVRDNASSGPPFWQLGTLDGAGRTTLETFGNGVATRHEYDQKKGAVTRIVTGLQSLGLVPPAPVQDLRYTYDSRLNVLSRQDWLQVSPAGVATERFDNDALDRLTCASFGTTPTGSGLVFQPGGGAAACTPQIQYAANGNIAFKSDVGHYAYDPGHKHAVKTAGTGTYAHDAVGNQIARPGATIEYTAFDLPSVITRTADNAAFRFDYDGDQQRIRKTTPGEETIYLDGLYERVTDAGTDAVKHRYYVAAGSATLAITRVAGAPDELAYVHPDALGSVDVVTDGKGQVAERRSYDAFGARRNPAWGKAPMTPPASKVNMGFTGHEPDDELGLVNMRGRIYDPKLGRFLMTDPIVSRPFDSQSWNPYSYVLNNPLALVDPSGFEDMPASCDGKCIRLYDGTWATLKSERRSTGDGPRTTATVQVAVVGPPKPEENDPSHHRNTARDDSPPSAAARSVFGPRLGPLLGRQWVTPAAPSSVGETIAGGLSYGFVTGLLPINQVSGVITAARNGDLKEAARVTHPWLVDADLATAVDLVLHGPGYVQVKHMLLGLAALVKNTGNAIERGDWNGASVGVGTLAGVAVGAVLASKGSPTRVVNSKMGHAAERAVERAGYASRTEATEALRQFGENIEKNGLPPGTVTDTKGRLVVPGFGRGGAVAYRLSGNKLTLQTVLEWIEGKGTPVVPPE